MAHPDDRSPKWLHFNLAFNMDTEHVLVYRAALFRQVTDPDNSVGPPCWALLGETFALARANTSIAFQTYLNRRDH